MRSKFSLFILLTLLSSSSASEIGNLAARMKPGEWAELKTNNLHNLISADGNTETCLAYAEEGEWDPITLQLFFMGGDHNDIARFIKYSAATNTWYNLPLPPWYNGDTQWHSYDYQAINPLTSEYYIGFEKYDIQNSTWSEIPPVPDVYFYRGGLAVEYFPEIGGVVANGPYRLYFYNELLGRWSTLATGLKGPASEIHFVSEYNPVHKVVVFGGGDGNSVLYKLDTLLNVTQIASAPVDEVSIPKAILTVDPVSGDYLLFTDDAKFWTYDVITNHWIQQNNKIPIFESPYTGANYIFGMIATPISSYGVVLFVEGGLKESKVYLYKHTQTIPDTVPPTPPSNLQAIAISETEIDLNWLPSEDNIGVTDYNIYRDGSKIALTVDTIFRDTGLLENTMYDYWVTAYDATGNESDPSNQVQSSTLRDLDPPEIKSVLISDDPTILEIIYSEPVEENSATNISSYHIDNGIAIYSADLLSDFKKIFLYTSPHSTAITYTLTVNNVYDRANIPNIILPNTQISYTYSLKLIVSNLTVSSEKSYVVIDSLSDGAVAYIDRNYTYSNTPEFLQDKSYIKTANDDKFSQESQFLSFEVNQSVKVYVAHDDLYEMKPDWLGNFTDTGENLVIDGSPMSVFERSYSGGTVTLGGNVHPSQSDSNNMYTVIIEGSGLVTTSQGEPNRTYSFLLDQNYPNPFNLTTIISYQVAKQSHVILEVYDTVGKRVQTLVNTIQTPGRYNVQLDGSGLSSGIYIYRLHANNFTQIRKMLLMK